MSFGTERSTPVGGNTLTGFIVSKARQSRKEARKEDRKEKRRKKKQQPSQQSSGGGGVGTKLLVNLPSIKNLFSPKKSETSSASQPKTKTAGSATGLAKILTNGFGSLSADTMGIATGLASVTQILNSSLKAQTFTATGIQTINSILSDQLENQSTILSTVKSLRPGGTTGGGKSMFGSARSSGTGGGTLTEFLINKAIENGIQRFITSRLSRLNPFKRKPPSPPDAKGKPPKPTKPSGPGGKPPKPKPPKPIKPQTNFIDRLQGIRSGIKNKVSQAVDFGKGLFSKAKDTGANLFSRTAKAATTVAENPLTARLGKTFARFGGRMLPVAGTAFSAKEAADRAAKGDKFGAWLAGLGAGAGATATVTSGAALTGAGAVVPVAAEGGSMVADVALLGYDIAQALNPMSKMSTGGVMLGEAGKEAVVDLNSNQGKKLIGQQSEDPGMKASGASTLAVVDQFIKGMGPLGSPVSQALGPDIQNLSRTFGMSQTLPNLKVGGAKFKEDGNAKKVRDDFLEKLIAGSLEALGAKKKDEKKIESGAQQSTPGDTGTQQQQTAQQRRTSSMVSEVNTTQVPGKPEGTKGTTGVSLVGGGIAPSTPDKLRPVEGGGNKFWYDKDGQIYHWESKKDKNGNLIPTELKPLNSGEMGAGTDVNGNLVANTNTPVSKDKRRLFSRDPLTGKVILYKPNFMETSGVGDLARRVTSFNPQETDAFDNNLPRGYYSYTADDILLGRDNKGKAKWKRASGQGDIPPFGGPAPKFQSGGKIEQKPWWNFLEKFNETNDVSRIKQSMGQINYGSESQFGTESSMKSSIEARVKALEDIIAVTATTSIAEPKRQPPKATSAITPVGATNETSSDINSAAIINIIGSTGGGNSTIPVSPVSPQSSADYINDPWPGGLAGVLCSSPWSAV